MIHFTVHFIKNNYLVKYKILFWFFLIFIINNSSKRNHKIELFQISMFYFLISLNKILIFKILQLYGCIVVRMYFTKDQIEVQSIITTSSYKLKVLFMYFPMKKLILCNFTKFNTHFHPVLHKLMRNFQTFLASPAGEHFPLGGRLKRFARGKPIAFCVQQNDFSFLFELFHSRFHC